jgi:hypothetical protein
MKHRIAILIPYFGDWPVWINFFIESCRWNNGIQWIIFNDRELPENRTSNVTQVLITFEEYCDLLSERLGVRIRPQSPYKLCDIKPALPFVHCDLVRDFDFVGFGDLDVIYGNLESFYDDALLADYDVLSSHRDRISGHLCLLRNVERVVSAFQHVRGWEAAFRSEDHVGFDERQFFNFLTGSQRKFFRSAPEESIRCFFHEAHSTPGITQRMRWYWSKGRLTNEFYPQHPFMYLHFMSWHSSRWLAQQPGVTHGTRAPWSLLPEVVKMDWRDARKHGFMISPDGIEPMTALA